MINLYKKSSFLYEATVKNIPSPTTVVKAYLAIKASDDAPTNLLLTTGSVSQTGSTATLSFQIPYTDLDAIEPGQYRMGIKLILAGNVPMLIEESLQPVFINPAFIEEVT